VTVSILVVNDESDAAELYRQYFSREVRQGTYLMWLGAGLAETWNTLDYLAEASIR
jgi:hypothetical protein